MKINIKTVILLTFVCKSVSSHSVIGVITDNITWFHTDLSVVLAMTATLEYHIQYPYVPNRARPIITFYYNGQDSPNLLTHCETDMYGQLFNDDLAVPLNEPLMTHSIYESLGPQYTPIPPFDRFYVSTLHFYLWCIKLYTKLTTFVVAP